MPARDVRQKGVPIRTPFSLRRGDALASQRRRADHNTAGEEKKKKKKLCLQPEALSLIDFVVRNQPPTLVSACLITSAEVEVAAAAGTATVIITCRSSPSRYSPSRVQDPGY